MTYSWSNESSSARHGDGAYSTPVCRLLSLPVARCPLRGLINRELHLWRGLSRSSSYQRLVINAVTLHDTVHYLPVQSTYKCTLLAWVLFTSPPCASRGGAGRFIPNCELGELIRGNERCPLNRLLLTIRYTQVDN